MKKLARLLIIGMMFAPAYANSSENLFKMCFAAKLKNGEVGCWGGNADYPFEEWLRRTDKKAIYIKAVYDTNYTARSIVKIYYKYPEGKTE